MEGPMKTCTKCGGTRFHANNKGYSKSWCGDCVVEHTKKYQEKAKAAMQQYKTAHGCELCGETRHWMLDFHHRDGREFSIRGREWFHKKTQAELEKCSVLCANCHRDVHFLYDGKVR